MTGEPVRVPGIGLGLVCTAVQRNDYRLGPFFTNADGIAEVTRDACLISVSAELATDLMGHSAVERCESRVAVRVWSRADIERTVEWRRRWGLVGREAELWGSVDTLIRLLVGAPNGLSVLPDHRSLSFVDWDGREEVDVGIVVRKQS